MQKRHLLILISFLAGTTWLAAQITVTNATFPAVGDALRTAYDFSPEGIVIPAAGGPFNLDYTGLKINSRDTVVFQAAANGMAAASFPNAELVVISELGVEAYYDVTATTFSALGFTGAEFLLGLPIPANLKFVPPLAELHAPLTFPNVFNSSSALSLAISVDEIPGEILDSLGVPSGFLDSIRVKFTTTRNDFVDGFGMISIPGGSYEVLRQKRTDYTDTRLEIHIPFLGWQDVTDLLPIDGFGSDTVITYSFISNTEKEPIAIVTMDSTGLIAEEVAYKDNGLPSAVKPVLVNVPGVIVSPNPATTEATFEIQNMPLGNYSLRLFNTNGQMVMEHELTSSRTTLSIGSLGNGIYLYHVADPKNRIVATGKLMKVNP